MIDLGRSPTHLLYRARQRGDELLNVHLRSTSNLKPRQFAVLSAIRCDPGLSQNDITERTGADRSTVTEMITRLERAGFVERRRSNLDARTQVVSLTPKGMTTVDSACVGVELADKKLLSALGEEEQAAFLDALIRISQPHTDS